MLAIFCSSEEANPFLECGGKDSATPGNVLLKSRCLSEILSAAVVMFREGFFHRSHKAPQRHGEN
jgi:hypothetical protein